jgi:hypothetical protein
MLNRAPSARSGLFIALAAVAVTFVLLRPVCEAWFGHAGAAAATGHVRALVFGVPDAPGDMPLECCASVSVSNTAAAPLPAATDLPSSLGLALAALVTVFAVSANFAPPMQWRRAPPPTPRSFYLRSARILR